MLKLENMWTALTSNFFSPWISIATFSPLCFWQWAASALFTYLSASKSPNFSLCTQAQNGQHYKYINQASAYPTSIINLSQADLMRDPYKKHRSRIGGNLPLCSGVAASSGNSIELSTAFPNASLDGHQVLLHLVLPNLPNPPPPPPHPQSHQEHSQSNLHLILKCPSSSCCSSSPSNPLNPLPNQWAPVGLKHGQSF